MATDEEPDNIIELRRDTAFRTGRTLNWGRRCKHLEIVVDEENRSISCDRCGESINAFDWVSDWARNETIEFSRADQAQRKLDSINKQIKAAIKELRSLDGKIRRRRKKLEK